MITLLLQIKTKTVLENDSSRYITLITTATTTAAVAAGGGGGGDGVK